MSNSKSGRIRPRQSARLEGGNPDGLRHADIAIGTQQAFYLRLQRETVVFYRAFRARGLMQSRVSADHGKHRLLTLTDVGRKAFAAAEAAAREQVDALLMPIGEGGRERLAEAMRDIRAALNGREAEEGT